MPQHDAVTALRRFGLGPKPGDMKKIAGDPRGFLVASLADKTAANIDNNPLLDPSYVVYAEAQEAQMAQRMAAALAKDAGKVEGEKAAAGATGSKQPLASDMQPAEMVAKPAVLPGRACWRQCRQTCRAP